MANNQLEHGLGTLAVEGVESWPGVTGWDSE